MGFGRALVCMLVAALAGDLDDTYERSVYAYEPVYCYQSLGAVSCYRQPQQRDARRRRSPWSGTIQVSATGAGGESGGGAAAEDRPLFARSGAGSSAARQHNHHREDNVDSWKRYLPLLTPSSSVRPSWRRRFCSSRPEQPPWKRRRGALTPPGRWPRAFARSRHRRSSDAAEAEELRRVGKGVVRQNGDRSQRHRLQTALHIAGQIEAEMFGAAGGDEQGGIGRLVLDELTAEGIADFIRRLADAKGRRRRRLLGATPS